MLGGERVKLLAAHVVGVNGAPGTVLDGELTIACGDAAIRPARLQRAGRPAMDAAEFLRGLPAPVGAVLQ
jgi:methionyl-tRNA formyltransferase